MSKVKEEPSQGRVQPGPALRESQIPSDGMSTKLRVETWGLFEQLLAEGSGSSLPLLGPQFPYLGAGIML